MGTADEARNTVFNRQLSPLIHAVLHIVRNPNPGEQPAVQTCENRHAEKLNTIARGAQAAEGAGSAPKPYPQRTLRLSAFKIDLIKGPLRGPQDVLTQVERTVIYERLPATEQDWFWRGIGAGSDESHSSVPP